MHKNIDNDRRLLIVQKNVENIITEFSECFNEVHNWNSIMQKMEILDSLDSPGLIKAVQLTRNAIINDDWFEVLSHFLNNPFNDFKQIYIGPIRGRTQINVSPGLLFIEIKEQSTLAQDQISRYLRENVANFFACDFNWSDRRVEFVNLLSSGGSWFGKNYKNIALFPPFNFIGKNDLGKLPSSIGRRTLMFSNIITERHLNYYLKYPNINIIIDGRKYDPTSINQDDLTKAIEIWIALHELCHSSGPLPLHGKLVSKERTGLAYADIEETRVEMSSWILMGLLKLDLFFKDLPLQEVLITERLIRCCINNISHKDRYDNVETGIAAFITTALLRDNALKYEDNSIIVSSSLMRESFAKFLTTIYEKELQISQLADSEAAKIQLERFSAKLRKTYLGVEKGYRFLKNAEDFYVKQLAQKF